MHARDTRIRDTREISAALKEITGNPRWNSLEKDGERKRDREKIVRKIKIEIKKRIKRIQKATGIFPAWPRWISTLAFAKLFIHGYF